MGFSTGNIIKKVNKDVVGVTDVGTLTGDKNLEKKTGVFGTPSKLADNTVNDAQGIYDKYTAGDLQGAVVQAGKASQDPGAINRTTAGDLKREGGKAIDSLKKSNPMGAPQIQGPDAAAIPQVVAPTLPPGMVAPTVAAPVAYTVPGAPTAATVVSPGRVNLSQAAPNVANVNFDINNPYSADAKAAQTALMSRLAQQSMGQGPSVAEDQLKRAQEANVAAVMSQLASARGGANPLLARTAMQTSADLQAQTARDAATARLQEQLQAQGLLGQVANQSATQGIQERGQDMGLATTQAGFQQGANDAAFNAAVQADLTSYDADVKAALANAGYAQESNLAKYGADTTAARDLFGAQQQKALTDAELGAAYNDLVAKYAGMGMDAQRANQQAAIDVEQIRMQGALGQMQADAAANQAKQGMLGGILQAGGAIIGGIYGGPGGAAAGSAAGGELGNQFDQSMNEKPVEQQRAYSESQSGFVGPSSTQARSDERAKTDIKDGTKNLGAFLDALSASEYRYKNEKDGKGRFISPMAQELEKTPLGKSMVVDSEDGKMVHYGRAAGTYLSIAAMLHDRLKKVEKGGKH